MPIPEFHFDEPPDLGLPRQPVPLRFAYLVTGLTFREFVGLLAVRHFDRYEHLTDYEYEKDKAPRAVRRGDYAEILTNASPDAPKSDLMALLPRDHFVWSDELSGAFSQAIDDCLDRDVAQAEGLILDWNPAHRGLGSLLEECVDLSGLVTATSAAQLTQRVLRKQETAARHERWHAAYVQLKRNHPGKSDSWIATKIARMPIADDRGSETIRKNMKDR